MYSGRKLNTTDHNSAEFTNPRVDVPLAWAQDLTIAHPVGCITGFTTITSARRARFAAPSAKMLHSIRIPTHTNACLAKTGTYSCLLGKLAAAPSS